MKNIHVLPIEERDEIFPITKKQTVYIPTKVEDITKRQVTLSTIRGKDVFLHETEVFVFTEEQLNQLLSDYTDKIVENVKTSPTKGIGFMDFSVIIVDKESITNQLEPFLKTLI